MKQAAKFSWRDSAKKCYLVKWKKLYQTRQKQIVYVIDFSSVRTEPRLNYTIQFYDPKRRDN